MQIGIDVGATKIEYILLHDNGEETGRSRIDCPKDYNSVIKCINDKVYFFILNSFLILTSRFSPVVSDINP